MRFDVHRGRDAQLVSEARFHALADAVRLLNGHGPRQAHMHRELDVLTVAMDVEVVDVPDPRVDQLAAMFQPRKVTRAQVQYNDIAGLAPYATRAGTSNTTNI